MTELGPTGAQQLAAHFRSRQTGLPVPLQLLVHLFCPIVARKDGMLVGRRARLSCLDSIVQLWRNPRTKEGTAREVKQGSRTEVKVTP